jgi:hypothetical protein
MPQTIFVKQNTKTLESFSEIKTVVVKNKIHTITAYDSPDRYVEPFIYIDGGAYDQTGTPVDALFYDTLSWDTTWDGRYV